MPQPGLEVQLQQNKNCFVEKVRAGRDQHSGGQNSLSEVWF